MADGLLLTRRERLRLFWTLLAVAWAPSLLLALVTFALGGGAVGWMILVTGTLLALFIATSARRVRGALLGGVIVAMLLFLLQLMVAWFGSHPIE